MNIRSAALCYLHCWDHALPLQGGLAFEGLLRRCRLDYSLASLSRIDVFLDALRKTQKINAETFLDAQENQNLLFLLAFYAGEIISRSGGRPVVWRSYEEMAEIDRTFGAFGKNFANCVTCCIPPEHGSRFGHFNPLYALSSRLLEGESGGKSIAFSIEPALGANAGSIPRDQPLPPLPPLSLLDLPARLAELADNMHRYSGHMSRPRWVTPDHGLAPLFDHAAELLAGRVVWGAVVQANSVLFERNVEGHAPGEVVYDPMGRMPPEELYLIGRKLFSCRGQTFADDPALTRYAAHLDNERSILRGEDISPQIIPYPLKLSSTFFVQEFLPGYRLAQPFFPMLVSDKHPGLARALPRPLWPQALKHAWEFGSGDQYCLAAEALTASAIISQGS
jgi:hypothetical protein